MRVWATRRARGCATRKTLPNTEKQLGQTQIPAADPLAVAYFQNARCDLAAADGAVLRGDLNGVRKINGVMLCFVRLHESTQHIKSLSFRGVHLSRS